MVKARVMGPQEVAGTVNSENPWELGGGKGTNREISMRGFEDTARFPKTLNPSPSVAARRLMGTPIFARGACGALVGTFSHNFGGVKVRNLIGFGPLHFDPRGQKLSVCMFAGGPRPWLRPNRTSTVRVTHGGGPVA